jgi:hypothetical protein
VTRTIVTSILSARMTGLTPASVSTGEPNPKQEPEAEPWAEGPKRDKVHR